MKILTDECVYRVTSDLLRRAGHDITTAQDAFLSGKPDDQVLADASNRKAILLTNDMHFSNILVFPPAEYQGIIVLKIRPRNQEKVHALLLSLLKSTPQSKIQGALIIVDQNKYRMRRG